jgi:hypothetical protein
LAALAGEDATGQWRCTAVSYAAPDTAFHSTKRRVWYAFDVLAIDGHDLRRLPLLERKRRLVQIMPTVACRTLYLDHLAERRRDLYRAACDRDLEGLSRSGRTAPTRPTPRHVLAEDQESRLHPNGPPSYSRPGAPRWEAHGPRRRSSYCANAGPSTAPRLP